MQKRLILMIILSNSLMLNPGALLTLAFKKMLYSRKMGRFYRKFLSTVLLILTQI